MNNIVDKYMYQGEKIASKWIECDKVPPLYHINKVSGLCFREDGKLLIVKKSCGQGWSLPGGKHKYDETTLDTLTREVDEETSVKLFDSSSKVLGYVENTYLLDNIEFKSVHRLFYLGLISEIHKPRKDPSTNTIREVKFIDPEEFKTFFGLHKLDSNIVFKARKEYFNYCSALQEVYR